MKLKTFKTWSFIWAIAFGILTLLAWYAKNDLGTVATLGGIALMFAWMWEEHNIKG